ncbi:protein of unknown function [Acetoanaerobium sticklandii]|uniref:Uncharacterized protein n=1 Tax=Acetoanaerobium sticklandii (strain ATCC 12662 / DSM 519 / JCM 1433 / CCUG 9281 / NCIMB 10654 / HF) TaxID=499177 RepID=E3PRW8_ACESD|nr:hypothetical protein [Acetoanaerobium sticklandii]CBH21622.1 protein of unknown function [Acetoanaerobium sticklandii]
MNGISFFYGVVSGILIFGFTLAFNDYNLFGIGLSDAWIAFLGAIVGGIITITGVYFTLKQNRELMEESHNKQMKLMLTQIRTQFWMEKFSDAIVFAEDINNKINLFIKKYNTYDLASRNIDINFFNEKINDIDKHSKTFYPKLISDENLSKSLIELKDYLRELDTYIKVNYNEKSESKIDGKEIEYNNNTYSIYLENLKKYVE